MSLSNTALLSVATGFSEYGIREIFSNNKKRYTTLSTNYKQALKLNKNVSKVRKNIEKHLERDGMIVFVSPRNKNSEFLGNVLNLTEDGIYNLRILRYLLSRHYFLLDCYGSYFRKGKRKQCKFYHPSKVFRIEGRFSQFDFPA